MNKLSQLNSIFLAVLPDIDFYGDLFSIENKKRVIYQYKGSSYRCKIYTNDIVSNRQKKTELVIKIYNDDFECNDNYPLIRENVVRGNSDKWKMLHVSSEEIKEEIKGIIDWCKKILKTNSVGINIFFNCKEKQIDIETKEVNNKFLKISFKIEYPFIDFNDELMTEI